MAGRNSGVDPTDAGILVGLSGCVPFGFVGTPKNCKKSACRIGCGALNAAAEFQDTRQRLMPNNRGYFALIVAAVSIEQSDGGGTASSRDRRDRHQGK